MPIDAIKIRTTIPGGFVTAGRPFSLTTTVTNPHEEPMEIMQYLYHVPYQLLWISDYQYNTAHEARRSLSFFKRLFLPSIWKVAASPPGQIMSFSMMPPGPPPSVPMPPLPPMAPMPSMPAFPGYHVPRFGVIQTILPGESQSYTFKAMLPNWLFVSGGTLTFQGQVIYGLEGKDHSSAFEITFPYRPPLKSTCAGAIVGSILGIVAKTVQTDGANAFQSNLLGAIMSTILTIILSLIAVAYTSRRSNDVQPVLTVEDFTGGAILGFLIGYMGHQIFEKFVPFK
jgi:hypothetical protein